MITFDGIPGHGPRVWKSLCCNSLGNTSSNFQMVDSPSAMSTTKGKGLREGILHSLTMGANVYLQRIMCSCHLNIASIFKDPLSGIVHTKETDGDI